MNLFKLLDSAARRYPRDPAIFHGSAVYCDWGGLHVRALRLAAGMRQEMKVSDRVAIVTANCPEYVEILFGAWAAGLVVVPVNAKLHVLEMMQILDDADASLVFASALLAPSLEAGMRENGTSRPLVTIGGQDFRALSSDSP